MRSARVPNKTGSDNTWSRRAACRDADPELFFPISTTGPLLLQVEEAKKVCRHCAVISECLGWALQFDEKGVWGCTTEEERRAWAAGSSGTPAPTIPDSKRCGNCQETKPSEEFPRDRNRSDGLSGWCTQCKNATRREKRQAAGLVA